MTDKSDIVLRAAEDTWNVTDIVKRYRGAAFVWARAFAADALRSFGWTLERIGHALQRDHSAVVHLLHKVESARALPDAYGDILIKYDTFTKLIQDYDLHRRTIHHTDAVGGRALESGPRRLSALARHRGTPLDTRHLYYGNRLALAFQRIVRPLRPQHPAAGGKGLSR